MAPAKTAAKISSSIIPKLFLNFESNTEIGHGLRISNILKRKDDENIQTGVIGTKINGKIIAIASSITIALGSCSFEFF